MPLAISPHRFSGDAVGKVGCLQLDGVVRRETKTKGITTSDELLSKTMKLLMKSGEVIHDAEAMVVQMGWRDGLLLVSTIHRVVVLNTDTQTSFNVGTKPRDGLYGGSFGTGPDGSAALYCARPGSRVWSANPADGSVAGTMNIKKLFDCDSKVFLGASTAEPVPSKGPQSQVLVRLFSCENTFLLAVSKDVLALVDPHEGRLLEWHADLVPDAEALCFRDGKLYALHQDGTNVTCFGIFPPGRCIAELLGAGFVVQAADVLLAVYAKVATDVFCSVVLHDVLVGLVEALTGIDGDGAADAKNRSARIDEVTAATEETYRQLDLQAIAEMRAALLQKTTAEEGGIITVSDGLGTASETASRVASVAPSASHSPVEFTHSNEATTMKPSALSQQLSSTASDMPGPLAAVKVAEASLSAKESPPALRQQPAAPTPAVQVPAAKKSHTAAAPALAAMPASSSTPAATVATPLTVDAPAAMSAEFATAVMADNAAVTIKKKKKKSKRKKAVADIDDNLADPQPPSDAAAAAAVPGSPGRKAPAPKLATQAVPVRNPDPTSNPVGMAVDAAAVADTAPAAAAPVAASPGGKPSAFSPVPAILSSVEAEPEPPAMAAAQPAVPITIVTPISPPTVADPLPVPAAGQRLQTPESSPKASRSGGSSPKVAKAMIAPLDIPGTPLMSDSSRPTSPLAVGEVVIKKKRKSESGKSRRKSASSLKSKSKDKKKKSMVVDIAEGPAETDLAIARDVAASAAASPVTTPSTSRRGSISTGGSGEPGPANLGFSTYVFDDDEEGDAFPADAAPDISVMELFKIEERVAEFNKATEATRDELLGMPIPVDLLLLRIKLKEWIADLDTTVVTGYRLSEKRDIAGMKRSESPVGDLLFRCLEMEMFGVVTDKDAFVQRYLHCFDPSKLARYCSVRKYETCLAILWQHQRDKTDWGKLAMMLEKKMKAGADVNSILELVRNSGSHLGVIRAILPQLFRYDLEAASTLCVRSFPTVLPWHVHKALDGNMSIDTAAVMLGYLDTLVGGRTDQLDDLGRDAARLDADLMHEYIELMLDTGQPARSALFRGHSDHVDSGPAVSVSPPLSQAHHVVWTRQDQVVRILLSTDTYAYSAEYLMAAFRSLGFWPGFIILARNALERSAGDAHARAALANLFLDLGDMDSFVETAGCDAAIWDAAIARLLTKDAEYWAPLRVQDLIPCMAIRIGLEPAMEWSAKLPEDRAIPTEINLRFIKAQEIRRKQMLVRRQMLDALDSHLWSRRPTEVTPQLKSIIDSEIAGQLDRNPYVNMRNESFTPSYTRSPKAQLLSEPLLNWGALTSQTNTCCPICTLSLSDVHGETAVFRCGHSFHTCCVPEQACPICFFERERRGSPTPNGK